MTRRTFLKKSSLVLAIAMVSGEVKLFGGASSLAAQAGKFSPHAFLEIATDDTITVWVGQTNLGQGTHTGIPMVIADELDAAWEMVQVKAAPAGEAFKDPVWHAQVTGGSTSIRHRWDLLRTVGAGARHMLVQAASQTWDAPMSKCTVKEGRVIHPDGRSLSFGQLVAAARELAVPQNPLFKMPKDYRIMGTERQRLDLPDKVAGKTVFGMDFSLPGMAVAVVARPPQYGARVASHDKKAALGVKGVTQVVPLGDNRIAVCAKTAHAAMAGRDALNIQWSQGVLPDLDDAYLEKYYMDSLEKDGVPAGHTGDVTAGLAQSDQVLEQTYKLHYISHAQVEPSNCTAHVEKGRCRIWAPTQGPTAAQMTAAKLTGLPPEKVEVNILPAGGGFGLRAEVDPVTDAVLLSKALDRPVKVVYTREDEFANDYFRPANYSRIRAGLAKNGRITAWSHKVAAQSVMKRLMPQYIENGIDPDAVSGVADMMYDLPATAVAYVMADLPITVGWWRSVGYSLNSFVVESFMDELALAAGQDPVAFRLAHLEKDSRAHQVLAMVADRGGWESPLPEGRARGVAVTSCFDSFAAHLAEVSVEKDGRIRVHRMACAIDCGTAVYPDAIRAQAEAGVVMGLSVAFHERVHFARGGVDTANYHQYPVLTMAEVPPRIEVFIAENSRKAGGVGEPVFPSVAPAVANAICRATGVRLRELPFDRTLLAGKA